MLVKRLQEIEGTDREVEAKTWKSRRLLLADEKMGFSLHDTVLYAGTSTRMWYRNHLEAVYCIEGEGELENLDDGKKHPIAPGTVYALDAHDRHILHAHSQLRMVCVFNPPLTGLEVHDESGAYPTADEMRGRETAGSVTS
ncbi:MAG: ectoine synthase [Acidobacteria bacterium]|nr:MAG: ectoine synthase [Acidobacteriota bacterium]REK11525.1 MAG: ectoine synthase [Acidobacteriota bacterium]